MIEVLNTKSIKKARKKHICGYCSSVINIGEGYEYASLKYGMEYYEIKAHTYCKAVTQELISSGYFVDDGIGMTNVVFQSSVKRLHGSFCSPLFLSTPMTMSRDLARIFETKKLEVNRSDGFKEWILKEREETE